MEYGLFSPITSFIASLNFLKVSESRLQPVFVWMHVCMCMCVCVCGVFIYCKFPSSKRMYVCMMFVCIESSVHVCVCVCVCVCVRGRGGGEDLH